MPRLINADTVVTIQVYDDMTEEYATKKMTIAEAIDEWSDEGCPPAVDATSVRHGHWINHYDDLFPMESTQECSVCHAEQMLTMLDDNYCPNCGAKMDEEEENEAVS